MAIEQGSDETGGDATGGPSAHGAAVAKTPRSGRRTSLRFRLIGLAALGIALLFGERVGAIMSERTEKINAVRQHVLELADRGMAQYLETLAAVQGVLQVVSLDTGGLLAAPSTCERLNRIVEMQPAIASLSILSPDGIVACSTNPAARWVDLSDRDYVQIALRGMFNVSSVIRNMLSGNPSIMTAQPSVGEDGEIAGVVLARIDLDLLFPLSVISDLDLSAAVLMVDPQGGVIMAYPDGQALAGDVLSGTRLVSYMLGLSQGTVIADGPDGIRRIYGFRRLPGSNVRLAVGLDAAHAMAPVEADAWRAASTFLAACALIFIGLWLAGERLVVRPVDRLAQRFARFGRGETEATQEQEPRIVELEPLISAFAAMASQLTQREDALRDANTRLATLASLDPLTAVANRRAFDGQINAYWSASNQRLALLMVDVDCFKEFNDLYGHGEGDTCLRRVASALAAGVRGTDLVARVGGEEFAVLMPGADAVTAEEVASRLRLAVENLDIRHAGVPSGRVTASIGYAACRPGEGVAPADLFSAADKALYEAKHSGRNAVRAGRLDASVHTLRPARSA